MFQDPGSCTTPGASSTARPEEEVAGLKELNIQFLRHDLDTLKLWHDRATLTLLFQDGRQLEGFLNGDGTIERRPGAPGVKVLKPIEDGVQTRAVPVVGRVPAGSPMLAEENIEGWIRLPQSMASPASNALFLLSVRGTSMNKAVVEGGTIEDGDLILVRQQPTARSGDIIVGMVDGEATVKKLVTAPGYFILRPESKDKTHQDIVADRNFRIAGKVTHVLKKGSRLMRTVFDAADGD